MQNYADQNDNLPNDNLPNENLPNDKLPNDNLPNDRRYSFGQSFNDNHSFINVILHNANQPNGIKLSVDMLNVTTLLTRSCLI